MRISAGSVKCEKLEFGIFCLIQVYCFAFPICTDENHSCQVRGEKITMSLEETCTRERMQIQDLLSPSLGLSLATWFLSCRVFLLYLPRCYGTHWQWLCSYSTSVKVLSVVFSWKRSTSRLLCLSSSCFLVCFL